jgi:cytochrome c peroxidase
MARAAIFLLTLLLVACGAGNTVVIRLPPAAAASQSDVAPAFYNSSQEDLSPRLLRRFKPLVAVAAVGRTQVVDLGRTLYFDPRLSRDGTVSCNSCHPLDRFGTTNTAVSTGVHGQRGRRNAPSTYNASENFRQFWDGRAQGLAEQARGPLFNPDEMGMDETTLQRRLEGIEGYRQAFAAAFPDSTEPLSVGHVVEAIAGFERGLVTPARWDRYLNGDNAALTPQEKSGAKLFANLGCMVCHEGQLLGGSMYQKAGVVIPWPNQQDRGRFEISGNPADDMVFKVPSLRNVTKTAPYFNDGSVMKLKAAVQMMARHQLGVSLTDDESDRIVAWMDTLTGEIPAAYVRSPELPAAGHR